MMARWGWAAVVLAAVAVWANTLENGFHYDDEHSIVNNLHLRDLGNATAFFADPATFSVDAEKAMYRPLLVTTLALNFAWGRFDVTGYHVVNVLVHAANAALVWWLAGLLGAGSSARLLAGLSFAVHPVCSEPVNYISSRSESLAALFYLLAVCLFLRAGQDVRQAPRLLAGAWVSLAAGLLTKSTAITVPAVLLLLDALVLGRGDLRRLTARRLLTHHLPGWLVAAGYLAIVTQNQWLTRSLAQDVRAFGPQLFTQVEATAYYLRLIAAPVALTVDPQFFEQSAPRPAVALAGLLLVSAAAVVVPWLWARGRWRTLSLLAWIVLYALPTTVVPLNVLVNERRAYVPVAILCVVLALLVGAPRRRWGRPVAAAALIVLAALSVRRNAAWADDFTLWGSALSRGPLMARSHLYYGNAHKDAAQRSTDAAAARRDWEAAAAEYQRAIDAPGGVLDLKLRARNNLGGVCFALAQMAPDAAAALAGYRRAEEVYRQVVAQNPAYADALINLGSAALMRARLTPGLTPAARDSLLRRSVDWYERALAVSPNHHQAHANLGAVYEDLGRDERAESRYRHALHLVPDDWTTMKNLAALRLRAARAEARRGNEVVARSALEESRQLVDRALRLNPAVPGGRQLWQAVQQELSTRGTK